MTNRFKKILILIISVILGILIYFSCVSIPCIFHTIFNIPCPGCGMTRAFFKILSFDLIGAFSYNILSIPLFVFLIVLFIIVLYDIIKDKKALEEKGIKFLEKYYILIIILLIISMIVNIYRGI